MNVSVKQNYLVTDVTVETAKSTLLVGEADGAAIVCATLSNPAAFEVLLSFTTSSISATGIYLWSSMYSIQCIYTHMYLYNIFLILHV